MPKRRPKEYLFGIFVIGAGLVIIVAVTMVSRQATDYSDVEGFGLTGSGGPDSVEESDTTSNDAIEETDKETKDDAEDIGEDETEDTNEDTVETTPVETTLELSEEPVEDLTLLTSVSETVSGKITSYHFGGSNILNVMPISYKNTVLNEASVNDTQTITVAGVSATQYTISSAKDGSQLNVIHVERDGTLYDFRGSADFLNSLETYITFN